MKSVLIWCDLNSEQDRLEKLLGDKCVSIRGTTKPDKKIEYERMWRNKEVPVLITKPLCFGFGMNWQHCTDMIFVGLSDSYELYYQAVRRCWRFGQEKEVNVYLVIGKREGAVKENIERKEKEFKHMQEKMISLTKDVVSNKIRSTCRMSTPYKNDTEMKIPDWLKSELTQEDNRIEIIYPNWF